MRAHALLMNRQPRPFPFGSQYQQNRKSGQAIFIAELGKNMVAEPCLGGGHVNKMTLMVVFFPLYIQRSRTSQSMGSVIIILTGPCMLAFFADAHFFLLTPASLSPSALVVVCPSSNFIPLWKMPVPLCSKFLRFSLLSFQPKPH